MPPRGSVEVAAYLKARVVKQGVEQLLRGRKMRRSHVCRDAPGRDVDFTGSPLVGQRRLSS